MSMIGRIRFASAAVLAALTLTACDGSLGPGDARIQVLLTDAPADLIEAAWVDIGAIEILPTDGPAVLLTEDGTDGPVNLLELQNEVTLMLADLEIEAGSYHQIRLFVESASATLEAPYLFDTGLAKADLVVPSGAQTGIKLNLKAAEGDDNGEENGEGNGDEDDGGGVEISGDLVIVLDFDVNRSFNFQGNPHTPAGIKGVHFKPTLRVVVQEGAGSISGTVSTGLADVPVAGLTVMASPAEGDIMGEFQTREATATTDAEGAYTLSFVLPGSYTVTVETAEGQTTDPVRVEVELGVDEDVTDVDFAVVAGG
jgi:hypothetical protein